MKVMIENKGGLPISVDDRNLAPGERATVEVDDVTMKVIELPEALSEAITEKQIAPQHPDAKKSKRGH